MIEIKSEYSDKRKKFLNYWVNYLYDLKNMASHAHNYKELFKVIEKLEIEIDKESIGRDLWGDPK